jgi:hypothetical protein
MPEGKVANPVDVWLLVVVHSFVVIEAIHCVRNPRLSVSLCQTKHGIDVRFLLRRGQLSPTSELVYDHIERTCGVPFEPLRRVLAYSRRSGRWESCSARCSYQTAAQRKQCRDVHVSNAFLGRAVEIACCKAPRSFLYMQSRLTA